jgi:hypothetical protein
MRRTIDEQVADQGQQQAERDDQRQHTADAEEEIAPPVALDQGGRVNVGRCARLAMVSTLPGSACAARSR